MRWPLLLSVLCASCLRKTEFHCTNDSSCGAGGVCESTGFCSFADGECASGYRYSSSAGELADQCVGGTRDAGIDTPRPDMGTDTPSAGCPSGYNPLPGITGHVYKLIAVGDDWTKQQAACRLTSPAAYLAIPDDATELMALDTLAGAITQYWVGISDITTEGTWVTVLNTPQTFLPWDPPAPDNAAGGQGEDCVEALTTLHKFNDERCMTSQPAICECNP